MYYKMFLTGSPEHSFKWMNLEQETNVLISKPSAAFKWHSSVLPKETL